MDSLEKLKLQFHNAKQRARYWSGVPSLTGFGYNPASTSGCDADTNYEMALDDCAALADELERVTGKRPATPDPKKAFNEQFAKGILPHLNPGEPSDGR